MPIGQMSVGQTPIGLMSVRQMFSADCQSNVPVNHELLTWYIVNLQ
jgi:hypothetical protein